MRKLRIISKIINKKIYKQWRISKIKNIIFGEKHSENKVFLKAKNQQNEQNCKITCHQVQIQWKAIITKKFNLPIKKHISSCLEYKNKPQSYAAKTYPKEHQKEF